MMETPPEQVQWQNGELVNFSDASEKEGVNYYIDKDGDKTYFMGRGAGRSDEGEWLALYPAAALNYWEGSCLHFLIPHEQVVNKNDKPLYSCTQTIATDFKPLTAYLTFELAAGQPPVKEIRFCTTKYISGTYKVDFSQKPVSVVLDTGENRYREIVLKAGESGVIEPGTYTMAVFARILPEGMTVEIESVDGKVEVRKISKEIKFTLGKTRDFGVLTNLKFDDNSAEKYGDGQTEYPLTEVGKTLKSDKCQKIADVLWDTTFTVTPGLDYHQMVIVTDAGEKMDFYLLRVDQSQGLDLRAATSGNVTSSTWVRQIPSEMAAHMDSPEKPLYALVNADFCENRPPIRPRGPHHSDGKIWVSSYSIDPRLPQQALSFVGVTYDGKVMIAPNAEYQDTKKSLKECTGAGVILIKDSEIQGGFVNDPGRDPRTALGYTADNIVWILAVDGRHKGTEGMTYMEMASIFQSLGCTNAVNLDGGGSTQMLVRDPKTNEIEMRNWPSDPDKGFGGRERARLNGWCIIKR